jgi:hypothetical protein
MTRTRKKTKASSKTKKWKEEPELMQLLKEEARIHYEVERDSRWIEQCLEWHLGVPFKPVTSK